MLRFYFDNICEMFSKSTKFFLKDNTFQQKFDKMYTYKVLITYMYLYKTAYIIKQVKNLF